MMERLAAVGAPDLTLLTCANREDVDALSASDRNCLHPEYVVTHWSCCWSRKTRCDQPRCATGMRNGTLSLALKHQLAYRDVVRRGLARALILEDDSHLPSDMWASLAPYMRALPAEWHVFFAGSYSRNPRGGTLRDEPTLPSPDDAAPRVHVRGAEARNGTRPAIVGSNAYVVTAEGARLLLQPVRAETDIQLSLLSPSPLCKRTTPWCYPAVTTQRHCGEPRADCPITPPPRQYGPSRWLVWQDPTARDRSSHELMRGGGSGGGKRTNHK